MKKSNFKKNTFKRKKNNKKKTNKRNTYHKKKKTNKRNTYHKKKKKSKGGFYVTDYIRGKEWKDPENQRFEALSHATMGNRIFFFQNKSNKDFLIPFNTELFSKAKSEHLPDKQEYIQEVKNSYKNREKELYEDYIRADKIEQESRGQRAITLGGPSDQNRREARRNSVITQNAKKTYRRFQEYIAKYINPLNLLSRPKPFPNLYDQPEGTKLLNIDETLEIFDQISDPEGDEVDYRPKKPLLIGFYEDKTQYYIYVKFIKGDFYFYRSRFSNFRLAPGFKNIKRVGDLPGYNEVCGYTGCRPLEKKYFLIQNYLNQSK